MPILKQVGFVDDAGYIHLTRTQAARANLHANTSRLAFFTVPGADIQLEQLLTALETWRAERTEDSSGNTP